MSFCVVVVDNGRFREVVDGCRVPLHKENVKKAWLEARVEVNRRVKRGQQLASWMVRRSRLMTTAKSGVSKRTD